VVNNEKLKITKLEVPEIKPIFVKFRDNRSRDFGGGRSFGGRGGGGFRSFGGPRRY